MIKLFQDITCFITAPVIEAIGENEVDGLLQHFFDYEPPDTIKWVDWKSEKDDALLPMYTVSNGEITIKFWPVISDNKRMVVLELQKDMVNKAGTNEF